MYSCMTRRRQASTTTMNSMLCFGTVSGTELGVRGTDALHRVRRKLLKPACLLGCRDNFGRSKDNFVRSEDRMRRFFVFKWNMICLTKGQK